MDKTEEKKKRARKEKTEKREQEIPASMQDIGNNVTSMHFVNIINNLVQQMTAITNQTV